MRLKAAGGDVQAGRAQPFGKISIEPISFPRGRGVREGRPIAFAAVAVQSKLRNHQDFTAEIAYRAVHLALLVFKDAEIPYLVGERVRVLLVISFADAKEETKAGADPTDRLFAHFYLRFDDSLDNGAHGKSAGC
jgi:hypothetical protein